MKIGANDNQLERDIMTVYRSRIRQKEMNRARPRGRGVSNMKPCRRRSTPSVWRRRKYLNLLAAHGGVIEEAASWRRPLLLRHTEKASEAKRAPSDTSSNTSSAYQ